ncbi:hypothetical protein TNCV_2979251 [Trichonephila clavipes]|nr:hypothetical protein TNCV_2979251 [Trichonephila clavipes]
MGFISREFCRPGKVVKSSQAVNNLPCDKRLGIVLSEYCVGNRTGNKGSNNNKLHNLCDLAFRCQTAINSYQRCIVIQHYATRNHNPRYRTKLTKWVGS